MLPFLKSESAKLRESAKNWLFHAEKVYNFRKDLMSESEASTLLRLSRELRLGAKEKVSDNRLSASISALRSHMEAVGGNYYPRGSLADNVEFFFAAIIIYVGVTTFFVKPFKIPTNSMWPTYFGMTGEVYGSEDQAPGALAKALRFLGFGAKHYDVKAPASGEVLVPVLNRGQGFLRLFQEPATVKRYFVINSPGWRRSFYVGGEKVSFKYPADFSLERQVVEPLRKRGLATPYDVLSRARFGLQSAGTVSEMVFNPSTGRRERVQLDLIRTGIMVEAGESILSFDLMTGDQLFVDRMSYHFTSPKVGDGFVFKTDDIPTVNEDKFYIKRLVGTPGDTIRIEGKGLIVNGKPATGSIAFEKNAAAIDNYDGYLASVSGERAMVDLSEEQTVPEDAYFAIGDNSDNSRDGRSWGYVPESAVVGRPFLIYYPFTRRFGLAK